MLHKRGIKTLFLSVLVAIGLLGASLGFLVFTTQAPTAVAQAITQSTDPFATAWELVEQSNTYRFDTHIEQTSYPVPALSNVGRQPQTDNVYLSGRRDRQQDLLEITLWQNARGDANSGLAVRSQNGRTYSRNAVGEWEERDGFSELFAPGGEPLLFLQTATNISALGADRRELGGLTFSYQRYQFDLDTTAYARVMHRHLEAQLAQTGRLPAGMTLETPEVYRQMEGSGQVWLDDAGLPRRLEMVLEIPPQRDQGRVTARIVTDLSGFDRERIETTAVSFWQSPSTWVQVRQPEIAAGVGQATQRATWLLLGVGFLLLFLTTWRSHRFYVAVVSAVIVSMLVTPLLQGVQAGAFFDTLQAKQTEAAQRQASAGAEADMQEELLATDWDPHQNPVSDSTGVAERRATTDAVYSPAAMPALAATNTITDTTDTDGDGLIDLDEDYWKTCAYLGAAENCTNVSDATDTDGDGLSDGTEVHDVGTHPDVADTDMDGISDADEISGFDYAGQTWYLNPQEADSNKDGLIDGLECRARTETIPANYDPAAICPDTDGDNLPDVFDEDNDDDGIPDQDDLSPFSASAGFYDEANPLALSVDNLALDKPVFVDFQFRPQNTNNLTLFNHVLDWPSKDGEGQIQRILDTTWADTTNPDLRSDAANAANGDIRLVPMLEITMPYSDGHYANLPITSTAPVNRELGTAVDDWLDTDQLTPHGIEVSDVETMPGTLAAYLPLSQVRDRFGNPQAFQARMFYRPGQGSAGRADWGAAHQVRMIWLVQMITDQCPAGYDEVRPNFAGIYACFDPDSGATAPREEMLTIGHIYPDTWRLTGLSISEEHDFDMAILYEDPAQDTDLTADDQLMVASWNLSTGFLIGRDCETKDADGVCQGDGDRDVTVENLETKVASWFTDTYYINVETYTDYDHGAYLAYLLGTEVQPLLDTHFGAYTDTIPTFMYVQDHTSREVNLDSIINNSAAGLISVSDGAYSVNVSPADVPVQVKSSYSWTPYQYVNGTWQAAELDAYLTRLDNRLQEEAYFQPADDSEAAAEEAANLRLVIQTYYASLWLGMTGVTAVSGQALNARGANPNIPDAEYDPFFAPGAEFGAARLALKFLEIAGGGGVTFVRSAGWGGVAGYTALVLVTWAAIGLMFSGDQQLERIGEIVLASITLAIGSIYAMNALIAISNGGLSAGTSYPAIGVAGVLIFIAIAWGMLLFTIFTQDMSKLAIQVAVSVAIATTIFTLALFALSLMGLGVLGVLLALVDAIFLIMGKKGPSEYVIEYLAGQLFDVDMSVTNLGDGDRLEIRLHDLKLLDESQGFRETNSLRVTMGITNTIKYHRDLADKEERVAKRNVFSYTLQTGQDSVEKDLSYWDDTDTDQWTPLSGRRNLRTSYENSLTVPLPPIGAGINQPLPLNYSESFLTGAQTCWNVPTQYGTVQTACDWKKFRDAVHFPLDSVLVYDIFPATVAEFAGMNWSDTALEIPRQVDKDGDGLSDLFGADPFSGNGGFDTDQDGLGDLYEISNGYDATVADGDFDGLNDGQELAYGTNPFEADTDGDGLNDYIEVVDGWLIVYNENQLTRVWSDPFSVDADEDGLSDLDEFIFGFNPWTATDPSRILNLVQFDGLGVVETGAPAVLLSFEDAANSTAFFDSSGEGHHATCADLSLCPTVVTDGRYRQALQFDGVDDYATIRDTTAINLGQHPEHTISVWFWVDDATITTRKQVIYEQGGTGRGLNLYVHDGQLYGGGWNTAESGWAGDFIATPISSGQWHHAALVLDGGTTAAPDALTLYLDGQLVGTAAGSQLWQHQGNVGIGAFHNDTKFHDGNGSGDGGYLAGRVDELVLLNQAVTIDEVTDVMNGRYNPNDRLLAPGTDLNYQATVTNTSSTTATGFLVGESTYFDPALRHPAAAYSFEPEERLAYFVDETGGESAVVCVDNGTCPAQISGSGNAGYDTGLWFNGSTHTMRLPAMAAKTWGDQFNLSFWVNLNSYPAPGERLMLVDTDSDEPGAIDIYINSTGNVVVDIVGHPNGPGVDSRVLNLNNNHISLTGHYNLYINGSAEAVNPWFWVEPAPDSFQIGPGTLGNSLDGSDPFYGQIDELVFYNDFRNDSQVNSIKNGNYGGNTQLFRFEDLIAYNGTIFYDSQNNANHATCSGATCPTLTLADGGYNGRAAIFDGVDDFAVQPGNWTTQPINPSETVITLFVNPADYPTAGNQAYLYDTQAVGGGTTVTFDLYLDENGQLTLDYGSGSRTFNTIIPKNQWSKVQVVFARFSQSGITQFWAYLRVNDVQDSNDVSICSGSNSCQYTVRVGNGRIGNNLAGDAPFEGMLDQLNLRISNIDFAPPTVNVGYDNLANELRSASCPDVFTCPPVANGRYEQGISFDGVDDVLHLAEADFAQGDYTISTWFNSSSSGSSQVLLSGFNPANNRVGVMIQLQPDGRLLFLHRFPTSLSNGLALVTSNSYNDGQWHHMSAVRAGEMVSLYVDGQLVDSGTWQASAEQPLGLMLGRLSQAQPRYFNGRLDELVIVPAAVDAAGVQLLMNSTWPVIDVPAEFVPFSTTALTSQDVAGVAPVSPYAATSVHRFGQEVEAALELQAQISYPVIDNNAANLEMYIPFEDGPGTAVFDNLISYPNGFADPDLEASCASTGTCPTAGLRGMAGRAAYFDGRDDYLLLNAEDRTGPANVTAVSVWVNAEQGTILDINRGPTASDRSLDISLDRVLTNDGTGTIRTLAYDAPRNEWFHLVVSIDGSNVGTVYVNGTAVATGTLDAGLDEFTEFFNIGTNHNGHNLLQGYLDDLRLYSTPLSQADVTTLYETSAPLLRFEFDEDEEATIFTDNSINQYIAQTPIITAVVDTGIVTQTNPAPGTSGRIGNGIVLDGTGYLQVDAPDAAALTENFTIMGWIKPTGVDGVQQIIGTGLDNSSNGYTLRLANGKLWLNFLGGETAQSLPVIEPDVWQHIAVVFDANFDTHFYVDGALINTVAGTGPNVANTDDPLFIGVYQASSGSLIQPFHGQLDELTIYGREMTTAELYGIYLQELRWYRDKAVTYLTVDTDKPAINLLSDATYWPDGYTQLAVATTDATSAVSLLDFGLKAPGESEFSWRGAPSCAESDSNGAAWCPYFDSTLLGGEGAYEMQFRAVDAVGNETVSPVYTLYVDGTPPGATLDNPNPVGLLSSLTKTDEFRWKMGGLSGSLSDPGLSNGAAVAGSGLVTESARVQLIDQADGLLNGTPQQPTITGTEWSIPYELTGAAPQGTYTVTLIMEDQVGNRSVVPVGIRNFDERVASVDLYTGELPTDVISQTMVISGTTTDLVEWGGSVVEHHFEEPVGTTIFYNTGDSQYITRTHSLCSNCPTAGQPALFGDGVQFDGSDDTITIPFVINPATETFAASTWFNVTDLAGTRTILQQLDGSGTGRTWLYVESSNGKLQSHLGGSALVGETVVSPGEWHHAAVTYDGAILRLYLDGRLEASEARTIESTDGDMLLGVNKSNINRFLGMLDEFTLYNRALTPYEVYALAQPSLYGVVDVFVGLEPANFFTDTIPLPTDLFTEQEADPDWAVFTGDQVQVPATRWQYPLPAGLEDFYDLHLRSCCSNSADDLGRDKLVWSGLIDMITPTITVTAKHLTVTGQPVTEYSFTFSDFLLDDTSYQHPCTTEDLVSQTYNDARLPHDGVAYEVSGTCQVPGWESSRTFTACDTAGNCTNEIVQPTSAPLVTDVNGTGCVDISDVQDVASHWREVPGDDVDLQKRDVNSDGVINTLDVMRVVGDMGNGC